MHVMHLQQHDEPSGWILSMPPPHLPCWMLGHLRRRCWPGLYPPPLPGVWQGTDAIYTSEFNNIKIVLITFKELTTQSNTALSLGT